MLLLNKTNYGNIICFTSPFYKNFIELFSRTSNGVGGRRTGDASVAESSSQIRVGYVPLPEHQFCFSGRLCSQRRR